MDPVYHMAFVYGRIGDGKNVLIALGMGIAIRCDECCRINRFRRRGYHGGTASLCIWVCRSSPALSLPF
jgi:hypothetical protein